MEPGDYIKVVGRRGRYRVASIGPMPSGLVVQCVDKWGKYRWFPLESCSVDRKATDTRRG